MTEPAVVSVFPYPGGKARIAPWIADLLPPPGEYATFVDLFGGAANVLVEVMHRNDAAGVKAHYVYNDRDEEIVNFFRVIRDREKRKELMEMLRWTPFSRREYEECIAMAPPADPVERAWRFFILTLQSFYGTPRATKGRWAYDLYGIAVNRWLHSQERLERFGELFRRVQVECLDFADVVRRYSGRAVLVYADPPYFPDTRVDANVYSHELSSERHRELAELLNSFPGMAAVSGYCCPEYDEWYSGWERHDKRIPCSMSLKGGVGVWKGEKKPYRTESLWLNPAAVRARGAKLRQERLPFFEGVEL